MERPEFCAVFSGLGNLPIPDDLIDHLNEYVYCMAITAHKVLTSTDITHLKQESVLMMRSHQIVTV